MATAVSVFELSSRFKTTTTRLLRRPPSGNCCPTERAVNFFTAPGGFSWESRHFEWKDAVHPLHEIGHAGIHHFHKGAWIDTHPKNQDGKRRKGYRFSQAEVGKQRSRPRCRLS